MERDSGVWSLERDVAVARMMLRQVPVFFARALKENPSLASFTPSSQPNKDATSTPAIRLVNRDPATGDVVTRCIFNNLEELRARTSFFAVAFFGRRNATVKQDKGVDLLSASSMNDKSVVERIVKVDEHLTSAMGARPELRERILCYFSSRISEVDPNAHLPPSQEDDTYISPTSDDPSSPSSSFAENSRIDVDSGEYANLVLMKDAETVELWKSFAGHHEASQVLSPRYYSSVRIHNLHIHLSLPLDVLHLALSSETQTGPQMTSSQPLAQIFYPSSSSSSGPSTLAMLKAINPHTNKHLHLNPSFFDDYVYLLDIQTKYWIYNTQSNVLSHSGVVVHHRPSSLGILIEPCLAAIPLLKNLTTPIAPSLHSTRPLFWTSFLAGNAFNFYSSTARLVAEKHLEHPVVMLENYGVCSLLKEEQRWNSPLECVQYLHIDFSFMCGVRYVSWCLQASKELLLTESEESPLPLALVVAPVRSNERYHERPVYFTDFIVAKDYPAKNLQEALTPSSSPFSLPPPCFAFNEEVSFSGYLLVKHHLMSLQKGKGKFGHLVAQVEGGTSSNFLDELGFLPLKSGSHIESIRLVAEGKATIAGIDSVVLEMELQQQGENLTERIKVLEGSAGPCSMPPLVSSSWVPTKVIESLSDILESFGKDEMEGGKSLLMSHGFSKFMKVEDKTYNDLREILNQF